MCEADEEHLGTAPQGVDQAATTARRLSAMLASSRPRRAGISEYASARDHGDRRPLPRRQARSDHPGYDRQLTVTASPVR